MLTELDDDYWESSATFGNEMSGEKPIATIDGHSIVEQVLAGIIILSIGAAGAHLYDKYNEKKCR
jgi:hypothetical protein